MNTPADLQNTAILNRLILLVLSLILVCLVLLVVRAYTKPSLAGGPVAAAETPAPAEESIPAIVETTTPRPPPVAPRPTTNFVRAVPVVARPTPPPSAEPVFESTTPEREPFTTVVRGVGILPGGGAIVAANPATVDILGFATLLGDPKPEIPIDLGPTCGRINKDKHLVTTRHFVVNSEGRLANVLVYISSGLGRKHSAPASSVLLDQVGCMYQPYVLGLQTGQRLQVRNSDRELHNVHLTPRNNPERNVAQNFGALNNFTFEKRELFLRVKCDVHPWMFAYLGVFDHPFYAVTDTNGQFRLPKGLPAGQYILSAAHLKAGGLSQEIDFRPGEQKAIEFQFPVPEALQAQSNGTTPSR